MNQLSFEKYSGNGNHFIILDNPSLSLSREQREKMCDPHFGVGADGILLLTPVEGFDARMQIFNADGGEAEMCGNGIRCVATYLDKKDHHSKNQYKIKTMNGSYVVEKKNNAFAIEMSEIKEKNAYDLSAFTGFKNSFFINTGVPHLVFETTDGKKIDIKATAPFYRFHKMFPKGTNVSFLEVLPGVQTAYVRTYERGVEDETFSCGTGLTASGLALNHWHQWQGTITLKTLGGTQYVSLSDKVYYSGEVTFCFSGEYSL